MLLLYIVVGSYMEKLHLPVCHETGVMILIGIAVSFILKAVFVDKTDYAGMSDQLKKITVLTW
jgi:hypothetical protein